MPKNDVHLSLITEGGGGSSGGTTVTYMICRATVSAESGITFTVSKSGAAGTETVPADADGKVRVILESDEKIYVTVSSYPAGGTLTAETRGVDRSRWIDRTTYTIDSYNSDADDGNVTIHLKAPIPTPAPKPGRTSQSSTFLTPLPTPTPTPAGEPPVDPGFEKDPLFSFPWHLIIAAAAGFLIVTRGYITIRIIRKRKENRKKAEDGHGGNQ
ncbi:MAG: hypothetical protein MJ006_06205, partial [Methanocorpusculum sp.]|nr:hypothetical protein [Methanocorpusculum sp.]